MLPSSELGEDDEEQARYDDLLSGRDAKELMSLAQWKAHVVCARPGKPYDEMRRDEELLAAERESDEHKDVDSWKPDRESIQHRSPIPFALDPSHHLLRAL
jgi:hypothetical protein